MFRFDFVEFAKFTIKILDKDGGITFDAKLARYNKTDLIRMCPPI